MPKAYATTDGAALTASDEFHFLALDLIEPSLTNPRKHFDVAELVESIKTSGVHQPVLVRPLPGARLADTFERCGHKGPRPTHELVCGERRLRASKLVGLATIPALVRNLTDAQVLEIQLVENLQRTDLTELEEAEGYQQLMDSTGITADAVATKISKSRSYVFGRLKLLDLCFEARTSLRDGTIDASRALLVARIPDHKLQIKAMKDIVAGEDYYHGSDEPMTYRRAAAHMQSNYMLKLDKAKFSITSLDLVPAAGSCKTCSKRTGNDPDLFSDVKGADVCIDPPCFHKKEEAHAALQVAEAQARGQTVIAGKQALELMPQNSYNARFKGYKRLDDTTDSPTDAPLRKIIGKQMKADGIAPIMIEHPHKKGELVAALTNEVVARLLKAVQGQAEAAKQVSKEVKQLVDEKTAKDSARRTDQFEREWRKKLVHDAWCEMRDDSDIADAAFTQDIHRYLAIRAARSLSTDHAAAICQILDLGKISPVSAVADYAKETRRPELLNLLIIMQEASEAYDHSYGDRIANEGLLLVAGSVFDGTLDHVIEEIKMETKAKIWPEVKKPSSPIAPAAQAKGEGEQAKSQKSALRNPKLSAAQAQAAIAAEMQALETNPGADAHDDKASQQPDSSCALSVGAKKGAKFKATAVSYRGPNGETWSGRGLVPRWLEVLIKNGDTRETYRVAA